MPPRPASDEGGSSSSGSEDAPDPQRGPLNFLAQSEDPRTLSQIRRSRIDLHRRYVFLCPTSLSKHFDSLPHQAKDSALLVFRCSRSWLFAETASERASRLKARIDTGKRRSGAAPNSPVAGKSKIPLNTLLYRSEYSREFLQWVLTKEKEGCVFWYKPERDLEKLSKFFEEKIDPVSEMPYRPLLLDPQWWRVRFQRTSARFVGNPSSVIATISEAASVSHVDSAKADAAQVQDIAIPTLQELIFQSNPTLEPLAKWPHAPSMRFLPKEPASRKNYVQDTKHKGYIETSSDASRTDGRPGAACVDSPRIGRWPEAGRDRLDNLHRHWQVEEASITRRQGFARYGAATLGAPLTAR